MDERAKYKADLLREIGNIDVTKIVDLVNANQKEAFIGRTKAIILLQYLKNTGQFKAIQKYKHSSFADFMENEYGITEESFNESLFVLENHFEAAQKYGIGVIAKIRRTCGASKVPVVLKAITDEESKLKNPLPHNKILDIIKMYKKVLEMKKSDIKTRQE